MRNWMRGGAALSVMSFALAGCSTYSGDVMTAEVAPVVSQEVLDDRPKVDARKGLAAGFENAEQAAWNMARIKNIAPPPAFSDPNALWSPTIEGELFRKQRAGEEIPRPPSPISFANTDLAFQGSRVYMGNFHGINVYDVGNLDAPEHLLSLVCPGGQGDVSVHGNLLFHSVEQTRGRLDCGAGGTEGDVSSERFRGVRIFDISDISNPSQIAAVQTCRGSHTHTLVPAKGDENALYVYVSGTSSVRAGEELEGCADGEPGEVENPSRYRIDVIRVPLDAPQKAEIVSQPRIFMDAESGAVNGLWPGGVIEDGGQRSAQTNSCHDITVYPDYDLAAGACAGNGLLLDISDPVNPKRLDAISDNSMAYWHSATFSNDASNILFTDEWGGGLAARCQVTDPETWGADVVASQADGKFTKRGFFKIPNVQSRVENCVAHNGNLVPVPGRDIMVQGWYSGGVSVVDFTDPDAPFEIAYFDQGPVDQGDLYLAGYWAAYWHNGLIYGSEIARGLDVFELASSAHLSAAELEAAKLIQYETANPQLQEKFVWPEHPAVAQAYLDQLVRAGVLNGSALRTVSAAVTGWAEGAKGAGAEEAASLLRSLADKAATKHAERMKALADQLAG